MPNARTPLVEVVDYYYCKISFSIPDSNILKPSEARNSYCSRRVKYEGISDSVSHASQIVKAAIEVNDVVVTSRATHELRVDRLRSQFMLLLD